MSSQEKGEEFFLKCILTILKNLIIIFIKNKKKDEIFIPSFCLKIITVYFSLINIPLFHTIHNNNTHFVNHTKWDILYPGSYHCRIPSFRSWLENIWIFPMNFKDTIQCFFTCRGSNKLRIKFFFPNIPSKLKKILIIIGISKTLETIVNASDRASFLPIKNKVNIFLIIKFSKHYVVQQYHHLN